MPPSRKSTYPRYKRGRSKNFVVIKVDAELALGALVSNVAVVGALWDINDDIKVISARLNWSLKGGTTGQGPIQVGLAKDAYTVAQIIEALDASPNNRADDVQIEFTNRKVRSVGSFPNFVSDEVLNNGVPILTRKLYWKFATDNDLQVFAANRSGGTLTSGGAIRVFGEVYAEWT